jgi:hypothetical protein
MATYSAQAPSRPTIANTDWPTEKSVTCAPFSATTPEISPPGMAGNGMLMRLRMCPSRIFQSTGLMPHACARIRISSSFGTGRGTTSTLRTSGPP